MTEETEKIEKSEAEKTLSEYLESDTFIEFRSESKKRRGITSRMSIVTTIRGLNCVDMHQKFLEWIKNDKEFIEIQNSMEVAEKI